MALFDDLYIMTLAPTFDGGEETAGAGTDDQDFCVCFGVPENMIHEDPVWIILVNHDCRLYCKINFRIRDDELRLRICVESMCD